MKTIKDSNNKSLTIKDELYVELRRRYPSMFMPDEENIELLIGWQTFYGMIRKCGRLICLECGHDRMIIYVVDIPHMSAKLKCARCDSLWTEEYVLRDVTAFSHIRQPDISSPLGWTEFEVRVAPNYSWDLADVMPPPSPPPPPEPVDPQMSGDVQPDEPY